MSGEFFPGFANFAPVYSILTLFLTDHFLDDDFAWCGHYFWPWIFCTGPGLNQLP